MTTYIVKDTVQNNFNFENYAVIRDIFLGVSVYLFYLNANYDVFASFLKMIFILFIVRYLLANITSITDIKTGKRHFQISGHLIIFYIIIALSIKHNIFNLTENPNIGWLIVVLFSLFVIGTKSHTVSDILTSLLIIHFVFNGMSSFNEITQNKISYDLPREVNSYTSDY